MSRNDGTNTGHRCIEHTWIPLTDGRRLAARIWLPAVAERTPVPAILEYLPYRKRDGTAERDATTFPLFAADGYAGVRVDIAGSGESDGKLEDEYSEDELTCGVEVIAWMAAQPWCSGAIGMIGISWGGFNGLQIAMRRPAALKAIVTCNSTVDRYADDIHFMGGCLLNDNFNWGAQMTAYSSRPPDPALRDDWREVWLERLEQLPLLSAHWLQHQHRDTFWKHGSVCTDWQAINCAVLAIGGWADAYVNAPAKLVENLRAPAKALVGPWEHKYPHIAQIEPRADFHAEVLRWFDHWLADKDNGAELLPAYRAYIQQHGNPTPHFEPQAGFWISEESWPPPSARSMILHFRSGELRENPGHGEVEITSPQHLGDAAGNFCPGMRIDSELPDDQRRDDELSLCLDGSALGEPIEILGAPEVELEFSADRPLALLVLRLCDVSPDGVSQRVSYRPFNLTHWDSDETPFPLEPGKRYRVRFPLNQCGHRFQSGNKIRLALSTSYWPIVWPSPVASRITLHLEQCHLILPLRTSTNSAARDAPPPPREFPTLGAEVLRASDSRTEREILQDGTRLLRTFDDFGETRDPDHGLQTGSFINQLFAIHPEDPLSARAETRWRFTLSRGNWRVRIDSGNVMTSTVGTFELSREVKACEGEVLIFDKSWQQSVPRDCM